MEYVFNIIPELYLTNAKKNAAACRNASQVVKLKVHLFEYLVLQSWPNET